MKARTTSRILAVALLLGFLATAPTQAGPPAGRLLANQCAQCHGTDGYSPYGGFDSIRGESARDTYNKLMEMKMRRVPESIMDLQAKAYTNEQLLAIANYLATLKKP